MMIEKNSLLSLIVLRSKKKKRKKKKKKKTSYATFMLVKEADHWWLMTKRILRGLGAYCLETV